MEDTTYPTWLDFYVAGALDSLKQQSSMPIQHVKTDREAAFIMASAAMEHYLKSMRDQPMGSDFDFAVARHTMHAALVALTCPFPEHLVKAGMAPPMGIKLSRSLARDLSRAKAPMTKDWETEAGRATWYIDVPHHTLLVGEHQIRAILLQPTPGHDRAVAGILILTYPGQNEIAGRFAWMLLGGTDMQLYGSADIDVDHDAVRAAATDFVALVLLYHRQALEESRGKLIPRVDPDKHARLSKKKQQARQKTMSLFAIRDLRPPADHFGRDTESEGEEAWQLDHRVRVRGHFRWQPHGPARQLRKLIWIEAHERGPDAEKPYLDSLHGKK